ncbi:MAG: ABC transporter permease [Bacteroidota bacterium]|nr:ABC transporter permease [Bacteroidota bacterium]
MNNKRNWFQRLPGWNIFSVRWSWIYIMVIGVFAIIGPIISNEKPYYCKLEGKKYFPLFQNISEAQLSSLHPAYSPVNWRTTSFESIWRAPVPYSHYSIDLQSGVSIGPLDEQSLSLRLRHWLGTDPIGRDVLAGMIRGCRVSLLIGLGSMLLALLIGVPVGSIGGYWGNQSLRLSLTALVAAIVVIIIGIYVVFLPVTVINKVLIITGLLVLSLLLRWITHRTSKGISFPIDHIMMGLISIVDSFPALFIILILLFVIPVKGWLVVMLAIAFIRWPVMARYMRAEVYKMKESNYIKAAQLLNLPSWKILRHHIIPFAFRPVMISFVFGISSAILAESSLSFLGIGLPSEEVNWGRLLAQARNHFDSWWLVLFPGLAIFFTLLSFYTIGNAMQKMTGYEDGLKEN